MGSHDAHSCNDRDGYEYVEIKMKRSESKKLVLAGHDRPSDNNTDRGKGETSTKLKSD